MAGVGIWNSVAMASAGSKDTTERVSYRRGLREMGIPGKSRGWREVIDATVGGRANACDSTASFGGCDDDDQVRRESKQTMPLSLFFSLSRGKPGKERLGR